jgi:hypothetical protein
MVQQKFAWEKYKIILINPLILAWKSSSIRLTYLVEGVGPCPVFQTAGV